MAKKVKEEKSNKEYISSSQTYTKDVLNSFINFSIKNKWIIIILISSAIILLCSILMFVNKEIFSGFLYLFLSIIFSMYPLLIKLIMKGQNKKNINTTDNYKFFEKELEVSSLDSSNKTISTVRVLYSRLVNVKIYKNFGYIYVNKQIAYIISKNNFKNEEEFNFVLGRIYKVIQEEKIKK